MDWMRTHYERVLVVAAALILFLSSVTIWRHSVQFTAQLAVMPPAPSLKSVSPLAKAQELASATEKLHQPPQSPELFHNVCGSNPYLKRKSHELDCSRGFDVLVANDKFE